MADLPQPPWRPSITAIEVTTEKVRHRCGYHMEGMCLRLQPTRWIMFSSSVALLVLSVLAAALALLDESQHRTAFLFIPVHLLSKSWFGAFLFCRARLLYAGMRRPMGRMGVANGASVCVMFALSVALLGSHKYRTLVFVGGGRRSRPSSFYDLPFGSAEARAYVEDHGLELRSFVASAVVLADVLLRVLALKLYAAPLGDAIRVAATAGFREETAAYRAALKRHLALCALAVCSSCWTWCALVFAVIPCALLLAFLLWWQYVLWRTRTDALTALSALLSPSVPTPPESPKRRVAAAASGAPTGRRKLAKLLKIVVLVSLAGLAAPLGVLVLARGRTLRGRAAFVVADMAIHGLLCAAFLRTGARRAPAPPPPAAPSSELPPAVRMPPPTRGPAAADDDAEEAISPRDPQAAVFT